MIHPATRALACRLLGHDDPADLGLLACPIPDEELVEAVVAAARVPVLPHGAHAWTDDDLLRHLLAHLDAARTVRAWNTPQEPRR